MKNTRTKSQAAVPQVRNESDWVQEMNRHFSATGSFRASDVRRVLGDPLKSVSIDAAKVQYASTRKKITG